METFSALLAICAGQRPVTRSFDVFFDLRPNKRLSKQWWGWWFETPSFPLWSHCNAMLVKRAPVEFTHIRRGYLFGFVVDSQLINATGSSNLAWIIWKIDQWSKWQQNKTKSCTYSTRHFLYCRPEWDIATYSSKKNYGTFVTHWKLELCCQVVQDWLSVLRQQVITWVNVNQNGCHHTAPPGHTVCFNYV